jgi:hypothetical protein
MATRPISIDISDKPELLALIEQLLAAGEPRELRHGDSVLGVLTPPVARGKKRGDISRELTPEAVAAFEAAAGGWRGNVDVDRFIEENYEARQASVRPAVEL